MLNYILKVNANRTVNYLYRNDDEHPVADKMEHEKALAFLQRGDIHVSDEYEGYPLTSDDKYFFAGEAEEVKEEAATVTAADTDDKPKKSAKKRVKDVVCE